MKYPKSFEDLIDGFSRLPGVGYKSAERMAFKVLEMDDYDVKVFSEALKDVKTKIHKCKVCGHITENEKCAICDDELRDKTVICVVSSSKDVFAIEKSQKYNGLYHVLGGVISPSSGIGIEDLNFDSLLKRLSGVKEIILATNPTTEGEITALYISKLLKDSNIKISRIAYGVPMGANLDYTDSFTIEKAFEGRKEL